MVLSSPVSAPVAPVGASYWWLHQNGVIDYQITNPEDVSDTLLYSGAFPANDPTLTLRLNRRYTVKIFNADVHPFEVVARDPVLAGNDQTLLATAFAAPFETDPTVDWVDDGQIPDRTVSFTLSQSLVDAMTATVDGTTYEPGYRCTIHSTVMRGRFNVIGEADPTTFKLEILLGQQSNPGGLDTNSDGGLDAADLLEL